MILHAPSGLPGNMMQQRTLFPLPHVEARAAFSASRASARESVLSARRTWISPSTQRMYAPRDAHAPPVASSSQSHTLQPAASTSS
jgi:hypothetical protein